MSKNNNYPQSLHFNLKIKMVFVNLLLIDLILPRQFRFLSLAKNSYNGRISN